MTEYVRQRYSYAEYVELEELSPIKHEFLGGHVWAMAEGTPAHAAITANVVTELNIQLRGQPCRVYTSDLRIRVKATGLGSYPDVSVVCGEPELDPEDHKGHSVTNPKVVVEVLSPSTESYDRGEKLEHYKQIESLDAVVLVAQDDRRVEVWSRTNNRWTMHSVATSGWADVPAIACRLNLDEVYRDPLA